MTDWPFVLAGYGIILGGLAPYAALLHRRLAAPVAQRWTRRPLQRTNDARRAASAGPAAAAATLGDDPRSREPCWR